MPLPTRGRTCTSANMKPSAVELCALLRAYRFRFCSEKELQEGVARVLAVAGVEFRREVALTAASAPNNCFPFSGK